MQNRFGMFFIISLLIISLFCAPLVLAENPVPLKVAAVTASSDDGNIPKNTLDGKLDTRWSAKGKTEWIQYDLGSIQEVGYLGIAFYSGLQRQTKFAIEVSLDGKQWTEVYNGISSGKTESLEPVAFKPLPARYVKFNGFGNTKNEWNSISEIHIYAPNPAGPVLAKLEVSVANQPASQVVTYTKPGFINPDGSIHQVHTPNPVKGKTLNVVDFGADPADSPQDDRAAIQAAIDKAVPGDEVYLPKGVYNLKSGSPIDRSSHLMMKSGVNLRGESETGTILVSDFPKESANYNTKVLRITGEHDILVSEMTITAIFTGKYSLDHTINNPQAGGVIWSIQIEDLGGTPSYNVTVDRVTMENFQKVGVRISKSHDVVVRNSTFRNATDLGGGGAGYGVTIQGAGNNKNRIGYPNDCRYNLVENSNFIGPYIRHGILFQYYAHNSVARNNTLINNKLDAIDFHGEDEYLNEVYANTISDVTTGAAIGVGNSGATHDEAGPGNYIHDNIISNCREGIIVLYGSPDTIIENNIITNSTVYEGKGIYVLNGPRTIVKGNEIYNNKSSGFWGILLDYDKGTAGKGSGDPVDVQIIGNKVYGNTNGVKIARGKNITLQDNEIRDNKGKDLENKAK